ncbi:MULTISPECIES: histidine kinase [Actinoplanes]|uniref:sensor histidine kinase n=1 Tax=Actinoplanes TaxID=1865 RepID=UPI001FE15C10|nr:MULTISPECIES: histidine kinase [Actinoplanes]GLY02070.1 two-component sensor histidine kinase [Actinoplanes sp. NBRC 101535]
MLLFSMVGLGFADAEYLAANRDLPSWLTTLLAAGAVVPVPLALRLPVWAWRLGFVMLFLGVLGTTAQESWPWATVQILGFLFVLLRLAATSESAVTLWATGLSLCPVFLFTPPSNAWGVAVLLVAIAALGDIVSRRRSAREMSEITELERARRAVLEERARIAREMHDVVAHHMSMIAVQAETAPYRVDGMNDETRQEMAGIATTARSALTDMRRLLGALRAEDAEAEKQPQPGYAQITDLVATARKAGLPLEASVAEVDGVSDASGLATYRIVQEALANAARHAPGGTVRLGIRLGDDALLVDVVNELTSEPGRNRTGHGLIGMRERVTLLGGDLTAGPDGDGGYRVAARIPRRPETR